MSSSPLFEKFGKIIPKGTVLFREGDIGQEMYIIQSGRVKISKTVRNIEKTLSVIGKGEFFGEMAILNDKPRSATAEVVDDSEILVIDRNTFETMIKGNTEIALRIIKKLSQRLQEADNQIENLLIKDNTSRLVNLLAKIAKDKGIDTVMGGIVIDTTAEDMAHYLSAFFGQGQYHGESLLPAHTQGWYDPWWNWSYGSPKSDLVYGFSGGHFGLFRFLFFCGQVLHDQQWHPAV